MANLDDKKRSKLKSFLSKFSLSGAKESLGNRVYTVKSNLETKKMKETLARRNAQNKFRKEYGSTYRPSDESRKDNIAYKKLLKAEREKYKDL